MDIRFMAVVLRLIKAALRQTYPLLVVALVLALVGVHIVEAAIGSLFSWDRDPAAPVPPVITRPAPESSDADCVVMPDGVKVCKGPLSKPE